MSGAITTTITVYRGEDRVLGFTMDPVVDISGWTMLFTVARSKNAATKLFSDPGVIISGAAGTSYVEVGSAELAELQPGTYYWDYWRTNSGLRRCLGLGKFIVSADVKEPE